MGHIYLHPCHFLTHFCPMLWFAMVVISFKFKPFEGRDYAFWFITAFLCSTECLLSDGPLLGARTQQWIKRQKLLPLLLATAPLKLCLPVGKSLYPRLHIRNKDVCVKKKKKGIFVVVVINFLYFFLRVNWCLIWKTSCSCPFKYF